MTRLIALAYVKHGRLVRPVPCLLAGGASAAADLPSSERRRLLPWASGRALPLWASQLIVDTAQAKHGVQSEAVRAHSKHSRKSQAVSKASTVHKSG